MYGEGPGCTPAALAFARADVPGLTRRRIARVNRGGRYVVGVRASTDGGHLAVELASELDDEASVLIVDTAGRSEPALLDAERWAWLDERTGVGVDAAGQLATVWRMAARAAPRALEARRAEEGSRISLLDAGERVALDERGGRIVEVLLEGDAVDWRARETALRERPDVISLAADLALFFDSTRPRSATLRSLRTARIVARLDGRPFYSRAAFSPDGARLALISHGPVDLQDDGDSRADGAPRVEIITLASGELVAWGDRQPPTRYRPAPSAQAEPLKRGTADGDRPHLTDRRRPIDDVLEKVGRPSGGPLQHVRREMHHVFGELIEELVDDLRDDEERAWTRGEIVSHELTEPGVGTSIHPVAHARRPRTVRWSSASRDAVTPSRRRAIDDRRRACARLVTFQVDRSD